MLRKSLTYVSAFSLATAIVHFVAAGMLLSKYYEDAAGPINMLLLLGVLIPALKHMSITCSVGACPRR